MRLAHIIPPKLLTKVLADEDTYHLCLCDLVLSDGDYASFYRSRSMSGRDFVVLDSNAFENPGVAAAVDSLARAAAIISPDAVVLPDAIGEDGDTTFSRACAAVKHWTQLPGHKVNMRFWACPHGVDYEDYLECVRKLAAIPQVKGLCIVEETMEEYNIHRINVAKDIWRETYGRKSLHLLGMLEDLSDLKDPWIQKHVMGCDSAKLARWGFDIQLVTKDYIPTYPGRGPNYFKRDTLTDLQARAIRQNLTYWNQLVAGGSRMSEPTGELTELRIGGAFTVDHNLDVPSVITTSDVTNRPLEWEATRFRETDPDVQKYVAGPYGDVQDIGVRFDLLPPEAMRVMAYEMWRGSDRYGLSDEEAWKKQSLRRFLNHALNHINDYLAGMRGEDDLAHAACDLMFALHIDIKLHEQMGVERTFDPAQKRAKPSKGGE